MDLQYQQSNNSAWPVNAKSDGVMFEFSGSFSKLRIDKENAGRGAEKLVRIIFWIIASIGFVALCYSAYKVGYEEYDVLFIFRHHAYNLFVWIGILAGLYLWAERIHRAAEYEVTRVLSPAVVSSWSKRGSPVDVYGLFTEGARSSWNNALSFAQKYGASTPNTVHLFLSLLEYPGTKMVFYRFGVNPSVFKTPLETYLQKQQVDESEYMHKLPFVALSEALKMRNRSIDPLMLLCALVTVLPDEHVIQKIFFNLDLTSEKLEAIAAWVFNVDLLIQDDKIFRRLARHKSDKGLNKGLTAVPTPYLDQFSQDLTIAAKYHRVPRTLGRDEDLDKVLELFGQGKNVLIKGAVGTGRKTVVHDLAFRMASEQVPKFFQDKRLIKLELAGILGTKVPPEQALLNVFKEAEHSGNIVFAIENIEQLVKAVGSEGLSILDVLLSHLENSSIPVISTTTPEDYQTLLRNVAKFNELFATYELSDLDSRGVLVACTVRANQFEAATGAFFLFQAIEEAIKLTDQFFKDVGQPEKTIDVLKEAAQRVKNNPKDRKVVRPELIQEIVAEKTHVPTQSLGQDEADKLLNLEGEIGKRVIGQHEAVVAVAEGLRRARSGLSSGQRPLASFLFVGPTGVGKTELAKTLAKVYFGDERYLLRLDMSEYEGVDGMRKLLGITGTGTSTPFITHLKTYPFSLFLLDELEKASPDVLNLFLQVLEDGRITTAEGQTLDLTHTMVIGTSNAGTPEIQSGLREGKSLEQIKSVLMDQILIKYYRPEFLNRFDGIILFTPLEPEEVEQITRIQLAGVAAQLLEKKIKIAFSDAVVSKIATEAFDPLLGGRPIRRYIQDHVESVIAKLLLSKQLSRGSEVVLDVSESGEFIAK
jgi:ATP-dependent Clp protease ATP-binding subunit ClpA